MIFAASRSAAASEKVAFELSTFAAVRGTTKLLIVVVADAYDEGVPENVLPLLRDPIWIDGRAAAEPWFAWMTTGRRQTRRALLPLIAALVGAEPDQLIARDRKRRIFRRYVVAAVLLATTAGFAAIVLRTPDQAWMSTDADRIGRPLTSASVVQNAGAHSVRVATQWTEKLSDDALGREIVMALDFQGRQTGVVGVAFQAESAWIETKHTNALGSHGTLAADLDGMTAGTPKYRTFSVPDYIERLLRTPPAPSGLPENLLGRLRPDLASRGLGDPSTPFTHCFSVPNQASVCFLDFVDADTVLPIRHDASGLYEIGTPLRGMSAPETEHFAFDSFSYYVAMSIGDEESGYVNTLLRSRDALNWERTGFRPDDRKLKFTGMVATSGAQRTLAIGMSSVEFGPSPSTQAHVFLSTDEGATWRELNAGIPREARSTLVGMSSDGRLAALFGKANEPGGTLCIWRPLTTMERIIGIYGARK